MSEKLTPRHLEVISLALELCPKRKIAETLGIAYATLENHMYLIHERLDLPDRWAEFSSLAVGQPFRHGGLEYTKVPHATDRTGGYNVQSADGKRYLFRRDQVVEKL